MGKYGFRDNGIKVETITADSVVSSSIVNSSITYGAATSASVEGTVAKVVTITDSAGSTFYMPLHRAA